MKIMNENKFKKAIQSHKSQIGLWISLCSNFAADVVSHAGFDWSLLDMEHSPNEIPTVLGQLQAIQYSSTTPIVRPPWNDPVIVKRLLDIGAPGLLFPMVQSREEAESAVASTRYPPKGIRGVSMAQRGNKFGRIGDYFSRVTDETCVLVQLETKKAMSRAQEIANVEGVDGIFFGPADIAADMGYLGKPNDPAVWETIIETAQTVRREGKPVGTLVSDPQMAIKLLNEGFSFVACGTDIGLLARGADALQAQVRGGLNTDSD